MYNVQETQFPTRPVIGDARLRNYANGSLDEAVLLEAILEPRKSTYTLMELSVCRFGESLNCYPGIIPE